jgi:hypothetical protein
MKSHVNAATTDFIIDSVVLVMIREGKTHCSPGYRNLTKSNDDYGYWKLR